MTEEKELIKVFKISYDGAYYYDTQLPVEYEEGTIIENVILYKEYYENLPEFQGF